MKDTHLFDGWSRKTWAVNIACALCFPWIWFSLVAVALLIERLLEAQTPSSNPPPPVPPPTSAPPAPNAQPEP